MPLMESLHLMWVLSPYYSQDETMGALLHQIGTRLGELYILLRLFPPIAKALLHVGKALKQSPCSLSLDVGAWQIQQGRGWHHFTDLCKHLLSKMADTYLIAYRVPTLSIESLPWHKPNLVGMNPSYFIMHSA